MPLVKGFQPLTNVTKNSILDVTGALSRPLWKKKIDYFVLKAVFISFEVIKHLFTPRKLLPFRALTTVTLVNYLTCFFFEDFIIFSTTQWLISLYENTGFGRRDLSTTVMHPLSLGETLGTSIKAWIAWKPCSFLKRSYLANTLAL